MESKALESPAQVFAQRSQENFVWAIPMQNAASVGGIIEEELDAGLAPLLRELSGCAAL